MTGENPRKGKERRRSTNPFACRRRLQPGEKRHAMLLSIAFWRGWWFGSPPAPIVARPANLDEIHHGFFGRGELQVGEPGSYCGHVAHRIASDHDAVAHFGRFDRGAF